MPNPVRYTPPKVNPWSGIAEATNKTLSKGEIVDNIYSVLVSTGILSPDSDPGKVREIITGAISYQDGDPYLDVDLNKLFVELLDQGIIDYDCSIFSNEDIGRDFAELFVTQIPGLNRFFPDGVKIKFNQSVIESFASNNKESSGTQASNNNTNSVPLPITQNQMNNLLSFAEGIYPSPNKGEPTPSERREFSTLGEATNYFQEAYDSQGTSWMNTCVHEFFSENFVHLHSSVPGQDLTGWHVSPGDITLDTPLNEGFSRTIDGERRVVCGVYAYMGLTMISSIKNKSGEPAFNARIAVIYPVMYPYNSPDARPVSHAVLVYTDNATGRTYIMDNDLVRIVPEGMNYMDFIRGDMGYRDVTDIQEYSSTETYLNVPSADSHRVEKGENLWALVQQRYANYGPPLFQGLNPPLSQKEIGKVVLWIARENNLRAPKNIKPGQILIFPDPQQLNEIIGR